MADDQDKLGEILAEALAQPSPEALECYLGEACGHDEELRDQVNSLLKAHHGAGNFLRQSIVMPGGNGASTGEGPGMMIGRYKLLQEIGAGGFGLVFMAEQQEPVRRMVALKILKAGMDSREVIARFEAERQALALMDHPNIARVLDGGTTPGGRPYFVMDLVKGIPLTEFCERHQLPVEARLRLFVKVCTGVQHAHQKGVIHRDLKPTNVLVTLHDGEPVPKVIDFGIAKAIGQKLTERTLFTRYEQLIGTPAYMSPEQAEWSGLDVDTRSDLYSLGVLLYELLTGTTPLQKETLARAALDEVRRLIREAEPPKPSTRLTALMSAGNRLSPPAGIRQAGPQQETPANLTDGASLRRRLQAVQGDLDWIVMKALEKDRARRYETVNGLARDVERHLKGEPVVACPPSRLYQFRKLVQRHRLAITAASAVVAALVIGFSVSTWMFFQERAAKREQTRLRLQSEANDTKARAAAAKDQQIAEFLKDMLKGVGPAVALGQDTTLLKEILNKTANRLATALTNQPAVEAELRDTLRSVYHDLGDYTKAEGFAREVVALRRKSLGPDSPLLAVALGSLADELSGQGKLAEAETTAREALILARKAPGIEPDQVAGTLNNLASALEGQGKLAEAEGLYREAVAIARKLPGDPGEELAADLNGLANTLRDEHKLPEAESTFREALAIIRKVQGPEDPRTALTLNNLALAVQDQGKLAEAEPILLEALLVTRKVSGEDHPDYAGFLSSFAGNLLEQGKVQQAEALFREAYEKERKALGVDNPDLARALANVAFTLWTQNRLSEAESLYHEALAIQRKRLDEDNLDVARLRSSLADVLRDEGRLSEAELLYREALVKRRNRLGDESQQVAGSLGDLSDVLLREGKDAEAYQLFKELITPALETHAEVAPFLRARLNFFARRGRWKEAAADAEKAQRLEPQNKSIDQTIILLQVANGDMEGYRQACQQALARFTATNEPFAAAKLALDGVFAWPSKGDLAVFGGLADAAVRGGTSNYYLPQFQFCKALAEYRQGHFASAADWTIGPLSSSGQSWCELLHLKTELVLAMARWQLHRPDEARAALARAVQLAQANLPPPERGDLGLEWRAGLIAQTLLREAQQLIGAQNAQARP